MPYPRRLLNEGEEIAYDLRPHWWFFVKQAVGGVGVLALLVAVLQLDGSAREVGLWIFAIAAAAWAVFLLIRLARWFTTHFVVTNDRLIFRTGVLARHGREIPLERVNDITFNQSLWERIIGAGDLLIESAGEQGQQRFTDIPHPDEVQQEIHRQGEANEMRLRGGVSGGAAAGGEARAATIPEQIEQLAKLRDQGVLSADEFERKKRDLLDRM